MVWQYDPHAGGNKIDKKQHDLIRKRIINYAQSKYHDLYDELEVKFRGQFCYFNIKKDSNKFMPIGRMRFFSMERWSIAIYLYSNNTYEPGWFPSNEDFGNIDECIDYCSRFFF